MHSFISACSSHCRRSLAAYTTVALLAVTAATAQVATGIDNSGNYRSEMQACQSGQTQQDRETCMREARNAQAERQRGALGGDTNSTQANAMARCEPLTGEDRAACQARVIGYGSASGSVAGGGVLREVETVVLPAGQDSVTIQPKTDQPVLLVPVPAMQK